MPRCFLPLAVALLALARPLAGQTVTGVRDLNFGFVVRGVQTIVPPDDPIRSGQFYIRYVLLGRVRLNFTLPTVLNRVGGGATMPIQFRNGDAIAQGTSPLSPAQSFNPNGTRNITLLTSPDLNVWLGGRVTPAANQLPGTYRNTVVLTVNFL